MGLVMHCLGVMVIIIQSTGASTVAQDVNIVLEDNEPFTLANKNINVQSNEGVKQNTNLGINKILILVWKPLRGVA